MKKILILASVWCQNLWDELIVKNEIKYLEEIYWKCVFIVSTYDKSEKFYSKKAVKFIEYFPLGIKNPRNIFRNIRNFYHLVRSIIWSDFVVFWGWWIFYDSEIQTTKTPLKTWLFRSYLVRFLRTELKILWVSISIKNKESKNIIKDIFKKSSENRVRDKESFKILEDLGIESKIIPDFVFRENLKEEKTEKIVKFEQAETVKIKDFNYTNFQWKTVWLALRKGYIKKEEKFIKELTQKITKEWWKVILIPHSFHKTDIIANDYEFLKEFSSEDIKICENMKESFEIYSEKKIDLLIAMRLHSIILWYCYNIKTIPISYATKTESIIKTLM